MLAHRLEDVTVTHRSTLKVNAVLTQVQFQAQAAHHGCDEGVLGELTFALSCYGEDCHNLVAIYQVALLVHRLATV